jgi:hypothetical protein
MRIIPVKEQQIDNFKKHARALRDKLGDLQIATSYNLLAQACGYKGFSDLKNRLVANKLEKDHDTLKLFAEPQKNQIVLYLISTKKWSADKVRASIETAANTLYIEEQAFAIKNINSMSEKLKNIFPKAHDLQNNPTIKAIRELQNTPAIKNINRISETIDTKKLYKALQNHNSLMDQIKQPPIWLHKNS